MYDIITGPCQLGKDNLSYKKIKLIKPLNLKFYLFKKHLISVITLRQNILNYYMKLQRNPWQ